MIPILPILGALQGLPHSQTILGGFKNIPRVLTGNIPKGAAAPMAVELPRL